MAQRRIHHHLRIGVAAARGAKHVADDPGQTIDGIPPRVALRERQQRGDRTQVEPPDMARQQIDGGVAIFAFRQAPQLVCCGQQPFLVEIPPEQRPQRSATNRCLDAEKRKPVAHVGAHGHRPRRVGERGKRVLDLCGKLFRHGGELWQSNRQYGSERLRSAPGQQQAALQMVRVGKLVEHRRRAHHMRGLQGSDVVLQSLRVAGDVQDVVEAGGEFERRGIQPAARRVTNRVEKQ